MVDIVDRKTRSRMMAGIRSKNTKPEVLTRKALHRLGYRYRLGTRIGRITPDIVLPSRKIAVFVHGCYWHQHKGCKLAYSDRKYSEFWKAKFRDNKTRDEKTISELLSKGWRVCIIWECVTRENIEFTNMLERVNYWIKVDGNQSFETVYFKN